MAVQISGNDITVPRDTTVTRNLTVGGVLTYEDVTNVDSIGIVTARAGVLVGSGITLSKDGDIFATGVTTSTTFVGNLTGTASGNAALTGSTNNTVTTVTGANAIQGEANLTFDGDTLLLKSSTDGRRVSFAGDGTSHYMKYDNTLGGIILNGYGGITFETNGTNERLRIDSSGNLKVPAGAFDLRVGDNTDSNAGTQTISVGSVSSGSGGIGIFANPTNGNSFVQFGDGTSSADQYRGYMNYQHASDSLIFGTAGSERLRITSVGRVGINQSSPDATLHIKSPDGGNNRLILEHQTNAANEQNQISFENDGTQTAFIKAGKDGSNNNFGLIFGYENDDRVMIRTESGVPALRVGGLTQTNIYDSSGTGNEGAWLFAGAASQFAASNSVVMRMNRKTYNGKILAFYYNGSEVGTISTNANSLPSDRNYKKNISDLNLGLSLVNKLKPSQFNFKVDEPNTPVMYGLIAQELEESLISEGVTKNSTQLIQHNPKDNDKESDYDVDYGKLIPVLINAIKELSAEVEQLKSQLNN